MLRPGQDWRASAFHARASDDVEEVDWAAIGVARGYVSLALWRLWERRKYML